ncbi:MAG TPA: hypothetical protein VIL34_07965 [Actinopolymorphaceae bacterium]|jgi:hypothetical protein
MASKLLGKVAGIAATSAAVLLVTPGIASAAGVPKPKPVDGHKETKAVLICADKKDKKDHKKRDGHGPQVKDGVEEPAETDGFGGGDAADWSKQLRAALENGSVDGKIVPIKPIKPVSSGYSGEEENSHNRATFILQSCGDQVVKDNFVVPINGEIELEFGYSGAEAPAGWVEGGTGGATGPNTALAAGGAGALAAAALGGTVLLRRRTNES